MTVEALPRPQAVDAVAFVDTLTRTVTVRLPDTASGYTKLLWRDAWTRQRRSMEAGWPPSGSSWLYCDVPGARRVVHGEPVEGGQMSFCFPVGVAGFAQLVGKPGLVAIVTLDVSTRDFLTCRFLHRPGAGVER